MINDSFMSLRLKQTLSVTQFMTKWNDRKQGRNGSNVDKQHDRVFTELKYAGKNNKRSEIGKKTWTMLYSKITFFTL